MARSVHCFFPLCRVRVQTTFVPHVVRNHCGCQCRHSWRPFFPGHERFKVVKSSVQPPKKRITLRLCKNRSVENLLVCFFDPDFHPSILPRLVSFCWDSCKAAFGAFCFSLSWVSAGSSSMRSMQSQSGLIVLQDIVSAPHPESCVLLLAASVIPRCPSMACETLSSAGAVTEKLRIEPVRCCAL